MNTIATKYGVFGVEDNNNGGTKIYAGSNKVAEFPKLNWWDADKVQDAIEMNIELIKHNQEKQSESVSVTRDNAVEILEKLTSVLAKENNGFYSSRLKQCINKLRAA